LAEIERPGRYALELVRGEQAGQRALSKWRQRAQAEPAARVRTVEWTDALGARLFLLCTNCLGLVPKHLRIPVAERLRDLERKTGGPLTEDVTAMTCLRRLARNNALDVGELERLNAEVRRLRETVLAPVEPSDLEAQPSVGVVRPRETNVALPGRHPPETRGEKAHSGRCKAELDAISQWWAAAGVVPERC
jgi:hypothetical protein